MTLRSSLRQRIQSIASGNNAIREVGEGAQKAIGAVGKAGVLVAPAEFAYLPITQP